MPVRWLKRVGADITCASALRAGQLAEIVKCSTYETREFVGKIVQGSRDRIDFVGFGHFGGASGASTLFATKDTPLARTTQVRILRDGDHLEIYDNE